MSGVLKKIMPARAQAQPSMVVDLDDLIEKPVAFRFRGREYTLKTVNAKEFFGLTEQLMEIGDLAARSKAALPGDEISEAMIYEAYRRFICVLVPEFKVDILKEMTLAQIHAVVNLIIKRVTGQPMNLDEAIEKKKMTPSQ